jgi:hypothetical protein
MEQNTTDTANAPPIERRAWEAPRLISVIAVDRTRGGDRRFQRLARTPGTGPPRVKEDRVLTGQAVPPR